ncbi:MAG: YfiR family protein [Phycisphaerales bacterium]|nr:YfiR family protein [Phycisphaerales bacterium]
MTRLLLLILVLLVAVSPLPAAGAEPSPGIDKAKAAKVKAAYLYNFTKFTKWPDEKFADDRSSKRKAPIIIGVLGDQSFSRIVGKTIKGRTVGGRSIEVRNITYIAPPKGRRDDPAPRERFAKRVAECHLLYISDSQEEHLDDILHLVDDENILTVSDIEEFARIGGMVGFVTEQGKIIFEVCRDEIEDTRIKVSSKLLKLARIVKRKDPAHKTRGATP